MKITVTFENMEEFIRHLRPMEGFEDERMDPIKASEEKLQQLQAEAEQETAPVDDPPFEEKPVQTVTEDFRVEVRKFLAKLNKQTGKNTAAELIKTFGASRLTEVALEDLPALMEKAKEVANA